MNATTEGRGPPADGKSPTASPTDFIAATRNWSAIMGILLVEQLNRRTRAGKLDLVLTIAEPFALIAMFYFLRVILRGSVHFYGTSPLLFLASGILPFYLFFRVSLRGRHTGNGGWHTPRVNSLDVFMASVAAQISIWVPVIGVMFFGMWLYGIEQARPASIAECAWALFFLALFGAGLGLVNSAIARLLPAWPFIMSLATRGLLLLSGVIFIPDFFRPSVRAWLEWNPVLHGVSWFRLGVYGRYPDLLLDPPYLIKCAVILLFIGIVADRATLRYGANRT